ncbi:MAG TPA: hypothetical protein VEH04_12680 [Verrucomicrobiae bacterium]|nr:hypothetical protein [Verrucomicrobiae bacterium]
MVAMQDNALEQSQRIQVEMGAAGTVKVRVESFDPKLGWYTSASICLPLHQVALLEQALADMRDHGSPIDQADDNILPFPGERKAA